MRTLLDGNEAAAYAAKLARVNYVPNFPITPQTEFIEKIAEWQADGLWDDVIIDRLDSEHSVISAALGASAAGKRVFTASGSQGIMLMHEILYAASGMRLPIVMAVMSRAMAAPITLWVDHNDLLGQRDCGWLISHAETNQEVLDYILLSFSIAENKNVLLPAMVGLAGYILSYTREPVEVPEQQKVDRFLKPYKPKHAVLKKGKLNCQGCAAIAEEYAFPRIQQHIAAKNAIDVAKKEFKRFEKAFGRKHYFFEEFMAEDAELLLISQGAMSTIVKNAVINARKKGKKVGLLRLCWIRPWPKKELEKVLNKINPKVVGVLDRNIAPGFGGIMWPEIALCLYEIKSDAVLSNYILGLGGVMQTPEKIMRIIKKMEEDAKKRKGRVDFNDWEDLAEKFKVKKNG